MKFHRNNYLKIEGLENLEKIKESKKPAVFISGHFNNFELMAMQIEKSGINIAAIYRPLNNPYLNKTMEDIRKSQICKNQIKKGRAGTREIIRNLNSGNSIAIMIDQRVREGEKVPFFNNLASTTTIPAQLVKKYNCEIVPIYIERERNHYFKMYVSEPIKFEKTEKKTVNNKRIAEGYQVRTNRLSIMCFWQIRTTFQNFRLVWPFFDDLFLMIIFYRSKIFRFRQFSRQKSGIFEHIFFF